MPEGDSVYLPAGLVTPSLDELAQRVVAQLPARGRLLVGLTGAPGAGKSTLAAGLSDAVGRHLGPGSVAVVPMDGFHLADVTLESLGLRHRKGAPETFDVDGYAALLQRVRGSRGRAVFAPGFERELEQPLAAAVTVPASVQVVLTEGNYLLLDDPAWSSVRGVLDEVWFCVADDAVRRQRLVARHVAFGKTSEEAHAWVDRVDEPNAALVDATRGRADLVVTVD